MKSSARLAPIAKLAGKEEKQAAEHLAQARSHHMQQHEKLQQLIDYKKEYEDKFHSRASQGITGRQLIEYHRFLAQLDDAIAQQRKAVDHANGQVTQQTQNWKQRYTKSMAISNVVERHKVREGALLAKQEQMASDEQANNKAAIRIQQQ